jgi:hypothetical protein
MIRHATRLVRTMRSDGVPLTGRQRQKLQDGESGLPRILVLRASVNKSEKGVPGEVSPQPLPYSEVHRNLRFAGTNRGAEGAITCSRCVETE